MTSYEFEGKTAEEAIKNAAKELNVSGEELDVEIIEPGSAGIFGLVGIKKTKIRVNIQDDDEEEINENEENTENDLHTAKETLEKILSLIPVSTAVTAEYSDNRISLTITGDTSGLLIGRKGKTLDSLQYIVNKIVNKKLEKKVRVIIDSEDYRKRRVESLTQLAYKLGDKAKRIRKSISTNPLNPHDRRIVHLALKKDNSLDTRSRGEGLLKKVVIIPKK